VSADLELALRLADAADEISLPRLRTAIAFETKPDLSPVTEADRAVETRCTTTCSAPSPGRPHGPDAQP
jgi:histidinol-phosphatase